MPQRAGIPHSYTNQRAHRVTRDESAAAIEHDALDVSQGEAGMVPDVTAFFHDGTYTITYLNRLEETE